jgi:hypothetical protein
MIIVSRRSAVPCQVALALRASRWRIVATDDEVFARQIPVVELAEPKGRDGHEPNNRRGDEPTPGRYLLVSHNGHTP